MSWSENRAKESGPSIESLKDKVKSINAVLTKLSKDEDLHDDLKMPDVQKALQHWTGQKRLPPEEAEYLRDHRRSIYVLQRLQMLQMVCQEAGVKVPLDLMLEGKPRLPDSMIKTMFPKLWEVEYASKTQEAQKKSEQQEASSGSTSSPSISLPPSKISDHKPEIVTTDKKQLQSSPKEQSKCAPESTTQRENSTNNDKDTQEDISQPPTSENISQQPLGISLQMVVSFLVVLIAIIYFVVSKK